VSEANDLIVLLELIASESLL